MFKPETTISGRLENSSGEWISHLDDVRTTLKKDTLSGVSFKVAGSGFEPLTSGL